MPIPSIFEGDAFGLEVDILQRYQKHFRAHGYTVFRDLLKGGALATLREAVLPLRQYAHRRDMVMHCMEDTPRHMSTLGTQTLRRLIPALEDVYTHPPLIALLSSVYGTRILPLPEDAVDRFVFNHLHRAGDTHGAHFDDYPISFVFVFEAPHESQGGYVEICPNAASVHDIEGPKAQRIVLGEGDAYLLQSDTTAHRVAPITSSASRTALNFAYTTESFTPRMVTQSAQVLYS